jgi:hypothetical protein
VSDVDRADGTPGWAVEVRLAPYAGLYAAVVVLRGEHDLASASTLERTLAPLDGDVLVDLASCEFIDLIAYRIIRDKRRPLADRGHRLDIDASLAPADVRHALGMFDAAFAPGTRVQQHAHWLPHAWR